MLKRITETTFIYTMFAAGQRVGVAVSAGADSVALVHILKELAPRWNLALTVLHFDHKLRGAESAADARFVEELARQLGLPFELGEADVARIARETGDNLEQAARRARHEFFHGFLDSRQLDRVAVGHTRSDQAETVLYRLLRGSGTAGLAGIRPVTAVGIVRPLIEVERADVEAFLRDRGIAWREDSSNRELRFDRNRLRHGLIPQLEKEWNPEIARTLARTARVAGDEEAYWEAELERLAPEVLRVGPNDVIVDVRALSSRPRAVIRRMLRLAIARAKGDLRRIDFQHVERLLALVLSSRGEGRFEAPGLAGVRSFDQIRLAGPGAWKTNLDYSFPLHPPAKAQLPGGHSSIHLTLESEESTETADVGGYNEASGDILNWKPESGALELRNWRPGDYFQPAGRSAGQKLKQFFQQERVPLWERSGWPVIACEGRLIWARHFGVAEGFAAGADSRRVLRIREVGER